MYEELVERLRSHNGWALNKTLDEAADAIESTNEVFKIDAVSPDDFWITRDQAYNERLWKTWCESFFEYLKTRETIIPASEEGE